MFASFLTDQATQSAPIIPITKAHYHSWYSEQDEAGKRWLQTMGFTAEAGQICVLPSENGGIKLVVVAVEANTNLWSLADCPKLLPAGAYYIEDSFKLVDLEQVALGWGLACYRFDRYLSNKAKFDRQLIVPGAILLKISPMLEAIYWVRTLISTPTEDMGPSQLAEEAIQLAKAYGAQVQVTVGEDLLNSGFAGIYTVGRAAVQAPRLIDIKWGRESDPMVTLVGKGVCFDTGGLNLKSSDNMLLMRKDMGGAAHVLGLAKLIMQSQLPIRLRVLIPAVENAISSQSYRPGDIIRAKNGVTIEIGNTDAEGRVILADALVEASDEKPKLIIDFATLTGAARVALGTGLPALFSNHDELANKLMHAGMTIADPIWRLPLHAPYKRYIKGKNADLSNNPSTGMGGAITAALFLESFVAESIAWAHFDLMAWNDSSLPGRPEGGEAMAIRAVFAYLCQHYGK